MLMAGWGERWLTDRQADYAIYEFGIDRVIAFAPIPYVCMLQSSTTLVRYLASWMWGYRMEWDSVGAVARIVGCALSTTFGRKDG